MTAIVALPMYDAPAVRPANDAFWRVVADHLSAAGVLGVPDRLTRDRTPEAIWADPDLILAQTCGYPLVTSLRGRVRLVCTPVYRAEGCEGPLYRAAFMVRQGDQAVSLDDLRGRRCAVNDPASNSGANLLRHEVAKVAGGARFFSEVMVTGSHVASIEAVAGGRADIASVDCVTLKHMRRDLPDLTASVRVLAWSPLSPGLPFITGLATPDHHLAALRQALREAVHGLTPELCDLLMLEGFALLPISAYDGILRTEQEAIEQAYPALA